MITFISGNQNKIREIQKIIPDIDIQIKKIDLDEIQGTSEEIAIDKCMRAQRLIDGPVLIEDVSLCLEAYHDLPGPYIKHFLNSGVNDILNKMLLGFTNKNATAICIYAYSFSKNQEPILFIGKVDGKIVLPRGPDAFGFDNVFEPHDADGKTYAELSETEKNKISHRSKALQLFKTFLKQ